MAIHQKNDYSDYEVPSLSIGGAAVAGKGYHDISKLEKKLVKSDESMDSLKKALLNSEGASKEAAKENSKLALSMGDADKIIDAYNENMLNVSKSRVLGARAGGIYENGVAYIEAKGLIPDFKAKLKKAAINPKEAVKLYAEIGEAQKKLGKDYSSYLHHMHAFNNKNASVHSLRGHAIAQTIANHLNTALYPENRQSRHLLEGARSPEELKQALRIIESDPGKYGFLHKGQVAQFADRLLGLVNSENKPVADILNYLGSDNNIPAGVRDYLAGPSPDNIDRRLTYLVNNYDKLGLKDADYAKYLADEVRKGILGGPDWMTDHRQVGRALSMLGNDVNVIGQAKGYSTGIKALANKVKGPLAVTGALAGVYGSMSLYNVLRDRGRLDQLKQYAKKLNKEYNPLFKNSSMNKEALDRDQGEAVVDFLAAAPAATYGISNLDVPRDIAVTYGIGSRKYGGPNITAGHKNPAQAIKEILKDKNISPWYAKMFNVSDDIVRGPGGIISDPRAKPNVLIDTGFGALSRPSDLDFSTPRFTSAVEKIRPLSVMSYQTDVAPSSMRHAGATAMADPGLYGKVHRDMLGYGPNIEEYMQVMHDRYPKIMKKVKLNYLGDSFGPAVLESAIQSASSKADRGEVFKELMGAYKDDPVISKQLENARNKKLIVISGSSRGDYVAERARQIAEQIRLQGASDKVAVIGQFGDALKDPLSRRIIGNEDVIALGRMPNKAYTGLQSVADRHLASSGASAAAEAALMPTPISIPDDWGKWYGKRPKPGSLAGSTYDAAMKVGVDELADKYNVKDRDALAKLIDHLGGIDEAIPGGVFDAAGKIVSGDIGGLDATTGELVRRVRDSADGADKKKLADSLVHLMQSGDIEGKGDRLAPIADWNEGVIQRMKGLEGVSDYDPARIVADVLDDGVLEADKAKAAKRSVDELARIRGARKALNNSVYRRAALNYMKEAGKTAGALGIAGLLTYLGINKLKNRKNKRADMNKKSAEDLGMNPLQAILQQQGGTPERPGNPVLDGSVIAGPSEIEEGPDDTRKLTISDKGMDGNEIKMSVESSKENDDRVNFLLNAFTQKTQDNGASDEAAVAEEATEALPVPAEVAAVPAQGIPAI